VSDTLRLVSNPWREAIEGKYAFLSNMYKWFPILGGRLLKNLLSDVPVSSL